MNMNLSLPYQVTVYKHSVAGGGLKTSVPHSLPTSSFSNPYHAILFIVVPIFYLVASCLTYVNSLHALLTH